MAALCAWLPLRVRRVTEKRFFRSFWLRRRAREEERRRRAHGRRGEEEGANRKTTEKRTRKTKRRREGEREPRNHETERGFFCTLTRSR